MVVRPIFCIFGELMESFVFLAKNPICQLKTPPNVLPKLATTISAHIFSGNLTKYRKNTASELNGNRVADRNAITPTDVRPTQGIEIACKKA